MKKDNIVSYPYINAIFLLSVSECIYLPLGDVTITSVIYIFFQMKYYFVHMLLIRYIECTILYMNMFNRPLCTYSNMFNKKISIIFCAL
jgi:hypothetical protein